MTIREAEARDLEGILALYRFLKEEDAPDPDDAEAVMGEILADPRHHLLVGEEEGRVVSSCVAAVIPNLTRQCRPYAVVENVVTAPEVRGRGFATAMLGEAKRIAEAAGCYKIMLMTGSKKEETLRFYRNAGFNSGDKTAFIMWLGEH